MIEQATQLQSVSLPFSLPQNRNSLPLVYPQITPPIDPPNQPNSALNRQYPQRAEKIYEITLKTARKSAVFLFFV